jgi:hypothetical protein
MTNDYITDQQAQLFAANLNPGIGKFYPIKFNTFINHCFVSSLFCEMLMRYV